MASYYVWSGATGSANGTSWANAYVTLTLAFSGKVAGDVFYVAHDHAESTASAVTLTSPGTIAAPSSVICVNRAGSVPPVSADRRTTAQVLTTAASSITFNGTAHFDGIIFVAGSGAVSANIIVPNSNGAWVRFDNCSLRLGGTSTGSITLNGTAVLLELNNTTMSFTNVVHNVAARGGIFRWRNTPSALLGTIPTTLFVPGTTTSCALECIGVDLSAAGSGKTLCGSVSTSLATTFQFVDCKLNAAVTKSQVPIAHGASEVDFIRSGSSGVNYTVFRHRISGTLDQETTIVRTGGASDGTTPISWKIVTTANCNYSMPFECPPIAIWNDTVDTPCTITLEGIAATLSTDAEVWLDVEYLGDAASPQASFANDGMADLLATPANQTSSSAIWGGSTAAFKLAVTITAAQPGWLYARVKVGKPSATIYIDPMVVLS